MGEITFKARDVQLEAFCGNTMLVTLEADLTAVVEDIPVVERLHDLDPADIVSTVGAVNMLNAMGEQHFDQLVKANGDYYEALNAIGIEKIQEWINDYCSAER